MPADSEIRYVAQPITASKSEIADAVFNKVVAESAEKILGKYQKGIEERVAQLLGPRMDALARKVIADATLERRMQAVFVEEFVDAMKRSVGVAAFVAKESEKVFDEAIARARPVIVQAIAEKLAAVIK
jgi:hypothetical protein